MIVLRKDKNLSERKVFQKRIKKLSQIQQKRESAHTTTTHGLECLIEVKCETGFRGRSEEIKELVDDLAKQAVANPQVRNFSRLKQWTKPVGVSDLKCVHTGAICFNNIKEKIVEGTISKRLGELALLEQPYTSG